MKRMTMDQSRSKLRVFAFRVGKVLFGALVVSLTLMSVSSRTARAQSITLPTAFTRTQPFRNAAQFPDSINRADCLADDVLTFALTLSQETNLSLQVWAGIGTDCTALTARFGPAASCWLLYNAPATSSTMSVNIDSRVVVAENVTASATVTGPLQVSTEGAAVCYRPEQLPTYVTLYFMLVDGAGNVMGSANQWTETSIAVAPPTPPTNVTATYVNHAAAVHWQDSPDTDVAGYVIGCADAVGPGCETIVPQYDLSHPCGVARGITASAAVVPMLYSNEFVGVAAVDNYGNVGEVSAVSDHTCVIGEKSENIHIDGGVDVDGGAPLAAHADGGAHPDDALRVSGGCSVTRPVGRETSAWLWSAFAALALLRARRRSR
jgi:hypothetical protein